MNKKAIVLIELIIIIVLLAIVATRIAIYITESLRLNVSNIEQEKALYAAQAGVMSGIVDYKPDGLWSPGRDVNVNAPSEFYYHLGQNANFLWVDASNPIANGRILSRIPIKNINASASITVTDLIVSWTFAGNITGVWLCGQKVFTGTATSPASLNITDTTLTSGAAFNDDNKQAFRFSNNISATADIVVTFIFSDGSSYKAYLLKGGKGANKEFSIKATGMVKSGSTVKARRTLVATYDTGGTGTITSWEESQSQIMP